VSDGQDVLEIYGRDGELVRPIAIKRDVVDATKWHLAKSISLGGPHAQAAVIRLSGRYKRASRVVLGPRPPSFT
jgi:hypothetical protein